jgi:signal transduction histidine kinase
MSRMSLRARILAGAVLWSLGLFVAVSFLLTRAMLLHPGVQKPVHRTFEHPLAAGVALACLVAGFVLVRRGVAGVQQIRAHLSSLHAGRERRLEGSYPSEVQPLADDLNALLGERDEAVRRAVAKAGDLAHGLKTPLAVIANEADRVDAAGQHESAASMREQVQRMRRQLDYHLAHARAAASSRAAEPLPVRPSIDALVRTLARLHADRQLSITASVDAELYVRVQRPDLDEMVGNLLDNACRWATRLVQIEAVRRGGDVLVVIEDDGPGLDPAQQVAVLRRGIRADESATGSGLGLSIVCELSAEYGGSVTLDRAALGGLRAVLTLRSAD